MSRYVPSDAKDFMVGDDVFEKRASKKRRMAKNGLSRQEKGKKTTLNLLTQLAKRLEAGHGGDETEWVSLQKRVDAVLDLDTSVAVTSDGVESDLHGEVKDEEEEDDE